MPYLLYDVVYFKEKKMSLIQLSFDVLSELIKFNRVTFYVLDYFLEDSNEFKEFVGKICSPTFIVDANLLIRSVYLTIYKFAKEKKEFRSRIADELTKRKIEIILTIVKNMNATDINQNNISCILTSLIILYNDYRFGCLQETCGKLKASLADYDEWRQGYK